MTAATLATATSADNRKAVIAGTIGNVLEWYDFGVYGYFATTMSHRQRGSLLKWHPCTHAEQQVRACIRVSGSKSPPADDDPHLGFVRGADFGRVASGTGSGSG